MPLLAKSHLPDLGKIQNYRNIFLNFIKIILQGYQLVFSIRSSENSSESQKVLLGYLYIFVFINKYVLT